MRALVIYESMFGNTELIANAIREGLSASLHADAVEVGKAPTSLPRDVGLIVVGAPTHAFGMSRPSTRADALRQSDAPLVSKTGVREWTDELVSAEHPISFAAFDTHLEHPHLIAKMGSAAKPIQRRLQKLGFAAVTDPQHFWVTATSGPLNAGELERASDWGSFVAAQTSAREPTEATAQRPI